VPVSIKGTGGGSVTLDAGAAAANSTLTIPNVTGTVLQSGTAVTVAQGGTGAATLAANNVLLGNGTSALQVVAPGTTGNLLTSNGTTWQSTAPASTGITSGTAQASTSGTSITFTGIPATAKKITVILNAVSTDGSGDVVLQVGAGSIQTSGYTGAAWGMAGTSANANVNWSTYATTNDGNTAASVRNGTIELAYLGSNIWSIVISYGYSNTNRIGGGFGTVTLSGTLDRVRITTSNGTDNFDAGSINILYQ
jgi:hypothetical protein